MIKSFFISLLIVSVMLEPIQASAVSLPQAQELALNNSPELKDAKAELEANEATLTRSSSRFFPRLGIESRYEYFDSTFEKRRGGTGNFFAEWNLFNGLQDIASRKAKSLDVQASELKLERVKETLNWNVEDAFSKVLAKQESIKLFTEAIEGNQNNKKAARTRRAAGVVSDADVLEFDLYESILKADLADTQGDLKQAQTRLQTLIGNDAISFPISGTIRRYKLQSSLEEIIGLLPSSNVEIRNASLSVERASAERMLARGGFLPEVRAFATYGSLGLRETEINPETYGGIVARWELFSGFDTIGARREAAARVALAETNLSTKQIAQRGEAEQIFERLKALEFRISLEEKNHDTAHRYLKTVMDEYRRGVKNSPDLKNATDNVLQSHLREVKLRSEYVEQAASLNQVTNGKIKFEVLKAEVRREEK